MHPATATSALLLFPKNNLFLYIIVVEQSVQGASRRICKEVIIQEESGAKQRAQYLANNKTTIVIVR
jgi:hypothetical protein